MASLGSSCCGCSARHHHLRDPTLTDPHKVTLGSFDVLYFLSTFYYLKEKSLLCLVSG